MAREYARIRVSIAGDEDIESLSVDAQWMYFRILIPDPTLNLAGVADWRPKRLLGKAAGLSMDRILAAAAELERDRYALFDPDTEEVLVRSFIRSDEVLRNPKGAVGVVNAYQSVTSRTLRAAIVSEVIRERDEHPEWKAWTSPISAEPMKELTSKKTLDPSTYTFPIGNHIGNRITNGITNGITNHIGNQMPNQIGNAGPEPLPTGLGIGLVSTSPSDSPTTDNQQPEADNRGWLRNRGTSPARDPKPNDPPPPTCARHPHGTDQPCRGCADARHTRERWDREHDPERRAARAQAEADHAAAVTRAATVRAERDACALCDDDGYQLDHDGNRVGVCHHNPDQAEVNERGRQKLAELRARMASERESLNADDPDPDPTDDPDGEDQP